MDAPQLSKTVSNSDSVSAVRIAGNGFELIQSTAGVAERASADHGHGHAAGRGQGRDEEAGLVADAAGGVLVDGEFAEPRWRELFAGVAHGKGKGAGFVEREAANPCGHQPGGELSIGMEPSAAPVARKAISRASSATPSRFLRIRSMAWSRAGLDMKVEPQLVSYRDYRKRRAFNLDAARQTLP